MNENIANFFMERKSAWLKPRLNPALPEQEQSLIHQEANERFALANWIPDAAKRANQLAMVSHPSKFSHPSAKTSSVIAKSLHANDGYLRSGNVDYALDVFGNAAAMDVYKFLSLLMDDGRSVLTNLEEETEAAKQLLSFPAIDYDSLKLGLTSIKQLDASNKTDHLVKQVYFPVNKKYHLLSVLTPSGLLSRIKNHLDALRFSEANKLAKESRKKAEHHSTGYEDILDLTVTAFGGTKPQNISVLNSKNAGRAYLLSSSPPNIKQRTLRLPTRHFFRNTLQTRQFTELFQHLDQLIQADINNMHVREDIQNTLKYIIDQVMQRVFDLRAYGAGWSQTEHYQSLPLAQRIWLDDAYLTERESQPDWLDDVVGDFTRWIIDAYEFLFKATCIQLSDHEFRAIRNIVQEAVNQDQEFFK